MNRRNFFLSMAALPIIGSFLPKISAKPMQLPKPKPMQRAGPREIGTIIAILGHTKMGKTKLVEALATDFYKKSGNLSCIYDSDLNHEDRWDSWRAKRFDQMAQSRMNGCNVFVTYRLNRLAQAYGAGLYTLMGSPAESSLADWTFVIQGKSFSTIGQGQEIWAWRCVTAKDRFGDKPKEFTYLKMGDNFWREDYHTDGLLWAEKRFEEWRQALRAKSPA